MHCYYFLSYALHFNSYIFIIKIWNLRPQLLKCYTVWIKLNSNVSIKNIYQVKSLAKLLLWVINCQNNDSVTTNNKYNTITMTQTKPVARTNLDPYSSWILKSLKIKLKIIQTWMTHVLKQHQQVVSKMAITLIQTRT